LVLHPDAPANIFLVSLREISGKPLYLDDVETCSAAYPLINQQAKRAGRKPASWRSEAARARRRAHTRCGSGAQWLERRLY